MRIYAFADEASPAIDGQIAAMRRNGLNGLEIRGVDGENVSAISLEKAKEVRRKLDDAGLCTWSIGSPIGKIDIETGDFAAHLEQLRHTLEVAQVLGAKRLRMFSFYIPVGKDPADYRNRVIDQVGEMLRVGEGSGVLFCHENEKGIYGDIASRCLDLHKAFPQMRGVFDPANYVQCGQETWSAWEELNPYIDYLHIKDALADGSVVPAGKGLGNVKRILDAYRAQGGEDVTVDTSVQFNMMAGAFTGGGGDYVTLFEPTATEVEQAGKGYILCSIGQESGEIPYTAYFANRSYLTANAGTVQRFTNAIARAQRWVAEHTDREVAEAICGQFPDTDLAVLERVCARHREIDAWNLTPVMEQAALERLETVMTTAGQLKQEEWVDFDRLVDNSFAQKAS